MEVNDAFLCNIVNDYPSRGIYDLKKDLFLIRGINKVFLLVKEKGIVKIVRSVCGGKSVVNIKSFHFDIIFKIVFFE